MAANSIASDAVKERAFLFEVLLGNVDAVEFCDLIFGISQTWDDLVDGDKKVTPAKINKVFMDAMIRLPQQQFYARHYPQLFPVLQSCLYDWLTANELERGSEHEKTLAFVLRDSLSAIVVYCASIIGGHDHAIAVAPAVRKYLHDETLGDYLEERRS